MSDKDISGEVNKFMISGAPVINDCKPISFELLKVVARHLMFGIKTTREHAGYVMLKKYSHVYTRGAIDVAIDEGIADEVSDKLKTSKARRDAKRSAPSVQPFLMAV